MPTASSDRKPVFLIVYPVCDNPLRLRTRPETGHPVPLMGPRDSLRRESLDSSSNVEVGLAPCALGSVTPERDARRSKDLGMTHPGLILHPERSPLIGDLRYCAAHRQSASIR